MYPVSIGYAGAIQRINDLMSNGHHAEALVTTAFTVEKTLRRTLWSYPRPRTEGSGSQRHLRVASFISSAAT